MFVFHNLPMVNLSQVFSVDFPKNRGYDVARVTEIFSRRCLLVGPGFFFPKKIRRMEVVDFYRFTYFTYMGVSKNSGTSKSSILIGFSIINHPFWGTTIFGNSHMDYE